LARFGSTNIFVHRQATDRKKNEYTLKLSVKYNQNNYAKA